MMAPVVAEAEEEVVMVEEEETAAAVAAIAPTEWRQAALVEVKRAAARHRHPSRPSRCSEHRCSPRTAKSRPSVPRRSWTLAQRHLVACVRRLEPSVHAAARAIPVSAATSCSATCDSRATSRGDTETPCLSASLHSSVWDLGHSCMLSIKSEKAEWWSRAISPTSDSPAPSTPTDSSCSHRRSLAVALDSSCCSRSVLAMKRRQC